MKLDIKDAKRIFESTCHFLYHISRYCLEARFEAGMVSIDHKGKGCATKHFVTFEYIVGIFSCIDVVNSIVKRLDMVSIYLCQVMLTGV